MKKLSILAAGLIALLILGFYLYPRPTIFESLGITSDYNQYEKLVGSRVESTWPDLEGSPKRYSFLPARIPDDSEKIGFFYSPSFMQGGETIILRLKLPSSHLESVLQDLTTSKWTEVTDLNHTSLDRCCYIDFGIKRITEETASIKELPMDFRIFLFHSDLDEIKRNWNHNFLAFTAISTDRNEIIYYAATW